jgi:hypothetical protein
MTIELTNEEKTQIINQHIKNLMLNKYNVELNKVETLAVRSAEDVAGMDFDERISALESQIDALVTQRESLV